MSEEEVFRDMEGSVVVDKNGLYVGKIADFTFKDFKLERFIVKGMNEVLQEYFDITGEYSLLLPHEHVRRVMDKEVHISIKAADLEPIQKIGKDEQRFVVMRNVDVIASDGENLGNIIDGIFHKDNHFSLILGGSPFQRFLSKIGVQSKNSLFVPYRYIDRFDQNLVQLNKTRDDLQKVISDMELDEEGLKLKEQQELSSHDARMTLYNESVKDILRGSVKSS